MANIIFRFLEALEHIISETDRSLEEWIAAYKARHDSHTPPAPPVVTPEPPKPVPVPTPAPASTDAPSDGSLNFFEGLTASDLYVQNGVVAQFVAQHPNDPNVALLRKMSTQPTSVWCAGGTPEDVDKQVTAVFKEAGRKLAVISIYNIPHRDNGGQSAGGAADDASYYAYGGAIDNARKKAGDPKVVYILETDSIGFALGHGPDYHVGEQLKIMTDILTQRPGASVYMGVSDWNSDPQPTINYLMFMVENQGLKNWRGVAGNVSGYGVDQTFFAKVAKALGKHYVFDTSRNGNGPAPAGEWENVPGMALGPAPLTLPPTDVFDGNLWIKPPGESDGADNGAPGAGQLYYDRAVEMARNAK